MNQFLDRFLIDFSSVLDAKMVPCWPPFLAQDRPRGLADGSRYSQDALKTALNFPRQNASKTPQDASKTPQDASKSPPDIHVGRFLIDVWSTFDRCLVDFG